MDELKYRLARLAMSMADLERGPDMDRLRREYDNALLELEERARWGRAFGLFPSFERHGAQLVTGRTITEALGNPRASSHPRRERRS